MQARLRLWLRLRPGACVTTVMDPFNRIVVAADFGESFEPALQRAGDLANRFSAELTVRDPTPRNDSYAGSGR